MRKPLHFIYLQHTVYEYSVTLEEVKEVSDCDHFKTFSQNFTSSLSSCSDNPPHLSPSSASEAPPVIACLIDISFASLPPDAATLTQSLFLNLLKPEPQLGP